MAFVAQRLRPQQGHGFRETEVQQLRARWSQHDVPGLQITMHNAGPVRLFKRVANLHSALQRLLQRQWTFLQTGLQALALYVLHH